MSRADIAIIGAGLGGLTAALALQRSGRRVRIFEQAPVLGEVGAGISLSSGAGRGLASLGIGAPLLAASAPCPDVAFVHYRTAALLAGSAGQATADEGFATARHIHRADLHAILLDAVRANDPAAVATGKQLAAIVQDDAGVSVTFADGSQHRAPVLVGADGSRSVTRRLLFDDTPPDFAGQVAFRCLLPADAAAPFFVPGSAVVSVGPKRIFHRYGLRGGTIVNIVGIARSDEWQAEGWNISASPAEFAALYADFHPDVTALIRAAPPASLIKWGLFVRPPLTGWTRGRVTLLGDAAHPILPFLGLGAALAIEDGIVLSRALDAYDVPAAAFAAYEGARRNRVENVRTRTIQQGEIIQGSDPDRADMASSPSQDVPLFDYDPLKVPINA
jgi:salicylate hydroxylase